LTRKPLWSCRLQLDRASADTLRVRVFDKSEHFVLDT
jgi:hypothetical protein